MTENNKVARALGGMYYTITYAPVNTFDDTTYTTTMFFETVEDAYRYFTCRKPKVDVISIEGVGDE